MTIAESALHRASGTPDSSDPFVVGPIELDAGAATGPLVGTSFVAKDLFDVAGTRTGLGNPDYLAEAPVAPQHSRAVGALLAAGSRLIGKTVTDELAFSLSGTNVHYGTPRNPAAPGRIPGGSSSGSASAVASGLVDLALGTDTGGSIRIPASYCGIYGLRTTHGRISRDGVALLAPSFCTVGLFAPDSDLLRRGWLALREGRVGRRRGPSGTTAPEITRRPRALRARRPRSSRTSVSGGRALERAERTAPRHCALRGSRQSVATSRRVPDTSDARGLADSRTLALDGPTSHGSRHRRTLSSIGEGDRPRGRELVQALRAEFQLRMSRLLGDDGYLVQPAASGVAPLIDLEGDAKDNLRSRTLALTAIGGLIGGPVVSLPTYGESGLPIGLAVLGLPGDDDAVVELATRFA